MIPQEVMQQIRRIQIRTNHLVSDVLAGQYESVFKGRGLEFREVREYVPGDDIRLVDWNVTARTGRPHVKLLAEERELTVMLLVDGSGSGQFGSTARFKNELAAEFCSVLAISAIKNNDKVGLLIFTDGVELYVPPSKGRQHVLRVIREVLYFKPVRKGTNIPGALRFMGNVLKRRADCKPTPRCDCCNSDGSPRGNPAPRGVGGSPRCRERTGGARGHERPQGAGRL